MVGYVHGQELKVALSRCSSIFLTMNRLVSRKRSTQLARQLCSFLEKDEDGAPVMHLGPTVRRC